MKQMSIDHWKYIRTVLEEHGESKEVIEKCGFHYRTAFEHGFKHGVESMEVAQRIKWYLNSIYL